MRTTTQIIIIILTLLLVKLFINVNKTEVSYVESNSDNHTYLVRNLPDKQEASNMLAMIRHNINTLKNYLVNNKNKYPTYKKYIEQLEQRCNDNIVISESSPDSKYTSYSVNKGEEIVFCLRSKKDGQLHDMNIVMFVAIHEMSHIACPEFGHTPLFRDIFVFLLNVAMQLGIYHYDNYYVNQIEYCGMQINETPLASPDAGGNKKILI